MVLLEKANLKGEALNEYAGLKDLKNLTKEEKEIVENHIKQLRKESDH